jgi:hypothetical protein
MCVNLQVHNGSRESDRRSMSSALSGSVCPRWRGSVHRRSRHILQQAFVAGRFTLLHVRTHAQRASILAVPLDACPSVDPSTICPPAWLCPPAYAKCAPTGYQGAREACTHQSFVGLAGFEVQGRDPGRSAPPRARASQGHCTRSVHRPQACPACAQPGRVHPARPFSARASRACASLPVLKELLGRFAAREFQTQPIACPALSVSRSDTQ